MARVIDSGGVDYSFQPPKWCRHKDQFLTYTPTSTVTGVTCSNCGAQATGRNNGAAHDALMAIEKVAIVTEVPAP